MDFHPLRGLSSSHNQDLFEYECVCLPWFLGLREPSKYHGRAQVRQKRYSPPPTRFLDLKNWVSLSPLPRPIIPYSSSGILRVFDVQPRVLVLVDGITN